jgi:hypothetical protein
MMIAGSWCLHAIGDPSAKSLEYNNKNNNNNRNNEVEGGGGDLGASGDNTREGIISAETASVDSIISGGDGPDSHNNHSPLQYRHPHVLHHHALHAPADERIGHHPHQSATSELAAAATDYNNSMVLPGNHRRNANVFPPHRHYRPNINTSGGVGGGWRSCW